MMWLGKGKKDNTTKALYTQPVYIEGRNSIGELVGN